MAEAERLTSPLTSMTKRAGERKEKARTESGGREKWRLRVRWFFS